MRFVREAFESNYIAPLGPQVDAFEREFAEYVGIRHCLALSSGTAAIHLALRLLGVGPGDEVIASTLTFIGSVTPIVFQGGIPVFVDCDRVSWNMDPELLAGELEACERRGKMPKAVVPTDLYGQCADYDRIFEICEAYEVPVVVDAAEALGAHFQKSEVRSQKSDETKEGDQSNQADLRSPTSGLWNHAGVGAKAAIFSFNGNKIITTSGGGMLASDDKGFIDQARKLSQQARENFSHYEHEEIGYNYRMSNILAAIGRGQLRVLDERVEAKRRIFAYYQEKLGSIPGIEFMPEAPYGRSNRWLTVILITPEEFGADKEEVRLALEAENIEARPVWKPMHMQPVFNPQITQNEKQDRSADYADLHRLKKFKIDPQITQINGRKKAQNKKRYEAIAIGGKVAEDLFKRGLCLPSGTAMTEEDLERIISVIKRCKK